MLEQTTPRCYIINKLDGPPIININTNGQVIVDGLYTSLLAANTWKDNMIDSIAKLNLLLKPHINCAKAGMPGKNHASNANTHNAYS